MAPFISTAANLVRARAAESLSDVTRYAIDAASYTLNSSPTINDHPDDSPNRILARQQTPQSAPTVPVQTVPGGYTVSGPDPGTVVGITLGSLAGFLLVLWIIYTCINLGNPGFAETASSYGGTASVVTRKTRTHSRHRHSSRHHGHHRGSRIEVRTTSTSRPAGRVVPVVVDEASDLGPRGRPHVERVVVEQTTRRVSGSRPPPAPGGPTYGVPVPGPRIVHSDDDESDDEVVVIEERSRSPPPRRHRSRRGSSAYEERRYSESRRR